MTLFLERVVDGISNGAVYAAMALALVLVFRSTGSINLAQGEMAMFTTFIAWRVVSPANGLGLSIWIGAVVAVAAGGLGGAALERTVIRPFEKSASVMPIIIVTLGLSLILDALAQRWFSATPVSIPSLFGAAILSIGQLKIQYQLLGLIGALACASALIWFLFQRTRLGLALRAAVDSPQSSRLAGIRGGQMTMIGWALAGALGSLVGILVAPTTDVSVTMMQGLLVYAFAAMSLGGFDSPLGAIVGGLAIGLVESLAAGYIGFIGNELSLVLAMVLIVVMLAVRPTGIFGTAETRRV
jgi:branched-chain amino acid transport system permease protein